MKKLLLLSVLCLFAQVKSEESEKYSLNTEDGRENFKSMLQGITPKDIKNDLSKNALSEYRDGRNAEGILTVKAFTECHSILGSLEVFQFTDKMTKELHELAYLCQNFANNAARQAAILALDDSPSVNNERRRDFQAFRYLKNRAKQILKAR